MADHHLRGASGDRLAAMCLLLSEVEAMACVDDRRCKVIDLKSNGHLSGGSGSDDAWSHTSRESVGGARGFHVSINSSHLCNNDESSFMLVRGERLTLAMVEAAAWASSHPSDGRKQSLSELWLESMSNVAALAGTARLMM